MNFKFFPQHYGLYITLRYLICVSDGVCIIISLCNLITINYILSREGNVFSRVCHSVQGDPCDHYP